jgi:hypothetical protein
MFKFYMRSNPSVLLPSVSTGLDPNLLQGSPGFIFRAFENTCKPIEYALSNNGCGLGLGFAPAALPHQTLPTRSCDTAGSVAGSEEFNLVDCKNSRNNLQAGCLKCFTNNRRVHKVPWAYNPERPSQGTDMIILYIRSTHNDCRYEKQQVAGNDNN